ncbi:amino acid-binding protein [Halovenus rubra]|uniref:Amino acid-binding protein n=2 Tax=Halovenus rubra TaxID=869890 RepID=A0ACC7DZF4_9EURY|nr:amino acid-binding protein [Halovenus rubra]
MSDSVDRQMFTVRLELPDRPGELRRALEPIAEHGGNLRSVFHERGNLTPRGHIPVEVDLAATPEQLEAIVTALRDADVTVVRAGSQYYTEEVTAILFGQGIDGDISETLTSIEQSTDATVRDVTLAAPEGAGGLSSARVHLATENEETAETLATLQEIAEKRGLSVVEPLTTGESA